MTENNSLKKQARLRMQLTGENYTTAYKNVYKPTGQQNNFSQNTIDSLFDEQQARTLKSLVEKNDGIIFVLGPTGSGKTTTVDVMVRYALSLKGRKIFTIEDPIEFKKEHSNLVQIDAQEGFTPSELLEKAKSMNPHTIVVEEAAYLLGERFWETAKEGYQMFSSEFSDATVVGTLNQNVNYKGFDLDLISGLVQQKMMKFQGKYQKVSTVIALTPEIRNMIRTSKTEEELDSKLSKIGVETLRAKLERFYDEGRLTKVSTYPYYK